LKFKGDRGSDRDPKLFDIQFKTTEVFKPKFFYQKADDLVALMAQFVVDFAADEEEKKETVGEPTITNEELVSER
jgi:hypothetical protein